MTPSLAVIIPCYNAAETIGEAIHSALGQDYERFEVIVCDNGSSDGSREVIAGLDHPRLKAAPHRDVLPRTDNWNRAYASGFGADYLVTLHADDRLAPGALAAIGRAAVHRPALIHGRFRPVTYLGTPRPGARFPLSYNCSGDDFRELLLLRNIVAVPGVTIRADVFQAAGCWDPTWNFLQDMELWWRCAALGATHYTSTHLGDQRDMKSPEAFPRHAAEYLRWATEKLQLVGPGRLRRAAIDGLSRSARGLRQNVTAMEQAPRALSEALTAAELALVGQAPPRSGIGLRQRWLRTALCLRSLGGQLPAPAPQTADSAGALNE